MTEHSLLRTLTHARLRAAQGDVEGARRLAEEIARSGGADADAALRFLASLHESAEFQNRPPAPTAAGRVRRLELWLARVGRWNGRETQR